MFHFLECEISPQGIIKVVEFFASGTTRRDPAQRDTAIASSSRATSTTMEKCNFFFSASRDRKFPNNTTTEWLKMIVYHKMYFVPMVNEFHLN